MAEAVERRKTLQERITEKIHDGIGDLITEDDLRDMVRTGVHKALFEGRSVETGDRWHPTRQKPPLVDELVERHLAGMMKAAVDAWLAENPERIQAAVDKAVQEGAGRAMLAALDHRMVGVFSAGVENLQMQGLLPTP